MEAIILAGGLGTRLRSVVQDLPKPMAKIRDKPFLEYLLNYLIGEGITRVILAIGYKNEAIISYFGDRYRSCEIIYSVENEPLGTGGAIKLAFERVKSNPFWIMNGDTFFQIPLDKMLKFHVDNSATLSISLKPMKKFSRYGNVVLDNQRILSFEEKVYQDYGFINGGIYLANKNLISIIDYPFKSFSFENYLSTVLVKQEIIFGFVCECYFIDIGIPEDYHKAQTELIFS